MTVAGIRNNNPFDVSLPIKGWNGGGSVVGLPGQSGFAQFPDMQTGYAAGVQRINSYITGQTRYGTLDTIGKLNSVYATDPNWAAGVSRASGIDVNAQLDASDPAVMAALQHGILTQELGTSGAKSVEAQIDASAGFGSSGDITDTGGLDAQMAAYTAQNGDGGPYVEPGVTAPIRVHFSGATGTQAPKDASTATQAGSQGAGTKIQTSLQPSLSKAIGGWVSSAESAFGATVQGAVSSFIGAGENWIARGFLIFIAAVVIFVALWMLLKNQGIVPGPKEVALAAV